jgi:hypothetical protein
MHLRQLRAAGHQVDVQAGVIKQRQQGTTRLNKLRRFDLDTRFPGLLESILRAAELDPLGSGSSATASAATFMAVVAPAAASAPGTAA